METLIEILINGVKDFGGQIVGAILFSIFGWLFYRWCAFVKREKHLKAEAQRLEEEAKKIEEARRQLEETQKQEEARKQAEIEKQQELQRQIEELKRQAEAKEQEEEVTDAQAKFELSEKYSDVIMPEIVDEKYSENYSDESFWDKITGTLKKAGSGLIYKALQLFYAMQNPDCPVAIKGAIIAALGYFILPIDLVPDVIPGVGFADDLAAIGGALTIAHMYINDEVIQKAQNKMCELFGDYILKELN